MIFNRIFFSLIITLITCNPIHAQNSWDIARFGTLNFWSKETGNPGSKIISNKLIEIPQTGEKEWNIGVSWNEERDVESLHVTFQTTPAEKLIKAAQVQYWFSTWPGPAPREHTIEDPMDDPWQGKWLTAETSYQLKNNQVTFSFKPISGNENPLAKNLPEPVTYRRSLKFRIVFDEKPETIQSLYAFSPTKGKPMSVKIEFGGGKKSIKSVEGNIEVFNGTLEKLYTVKSRNNRLTSSRFTLRSPSDKVMADLVTAGTTLPGSNDQTIVTIRSTEGNFSFATKDLEKGPIYIPSYSVYITQASDTTKFQPDKIKKGFTIRERIQQEPEQNYERASREIPPLNVMLREDGNRLYLPLAVDASWQKFAFEWGGGFYMNKRSAKAKGHELERCNWDGNELHWSIGTGLDPVYNRDDKNSHLSILNGYLPVALTNWNQDGLIYQEEAFATVLEGPLSPYNPKRDEQTPSILMVRLKIENPSPNTKRSHVWLKSDNLSNPILENSCLMDQKDGKKYLRSVFNLNGPEIKLVGKAIDIPVEVPASQSLNIDFAIPFPGDLTEAYREKLARLDYQNQREKVIEYWHHIVDQFVPYDVPEPKFCDMARSVIPHIRISTTKDPKTGLFMVPAASFGYQVYANESAFQTILMDKIGDHETAEKYLETFLRLQGTLAMPGTFTGDQKAVFHGGKIDEEYNYTSGPYNLDHGTVLWALALHYLLTGDMNWFNHASPAMLKAADWIIDQRNQTKTEDSSGKKVLHYGLLPAGRLEDNADWGFWFAVNAYAWLGLKTTADAFIIAKNKEGERLKNEADAYLRDLRACITRTSELAPVVRIRNNTYVPYVPTRAYQRFRYFGPLMSDYYSRYGSKTSVTYRLSATREALYGPLILITTGILDPKNPLSMAILDDWEDNITLSSSLGQHIHGVVDDEYWFSRGGMVFQPNLQNPIQSYLLRREIPAALRSIYNSMVSCLYPDVNAFTEEYRRWTVGSGPMYKIPDEARFINRVCDMLVLESGKDLWLASGTPRNWLEPGKTLRLNNVSTLFGKVSYEIRSGVKSNTLKADISVPSTPDQIKIFFRSPHAKPIKSVLLNDKEWKSWNASEESVTLPKGINKAEIIVNY